MTDIFAKFDPFKEEAYHAIVPSGALLGEYIPHTRPDIRVFVNGKPLTGLAINTYILQENDIVNVTSVPGKDAARTLFYVIAAAAAAYYGAALLFNPETIAAGGFKVVAAKAAFAALGTYAAMQIVPPPSIKPPKTSNVEGKPSITGSSNRASLFGPIPKIYGTYRYYPPLAAAWYTEIAGSDQYLRMLLCLGYGKLAIGGLTTTPGSLITQDNVLPANTIRIDQTDITNYSDYEYQIGYYDDISLFSQDIQESVPGLPLDWQNNETEATWVTDNVTYTQTSGANANELGVDLTFPNGLWCANSEGKTRPAKVRFSVEYRATGTSDPWVSADIPENTITLYDTVALPDADDGGQAGPSVSITPPEGMETDDFVTVFVNYRGNSETITVSNAGGQTWTSATQINNTNVRFRMFYCKFNGTWTSNPIFTVGSGTSTMTAVMNVWKGVDTSTPLDVSITTGTGTSASMVVPGMGTNYSNSRMIVAMASDDDNLWNIPAGWENTLRNQYRNSTGNDNSIAIGHKTKKTPGLNENVTFTKTTQNTSANTAYYKFALNTNSIWEFKGPIKETIRKNITWKVGGGTYDVRVTRISSFHQDTETVFSNAIWTALRTIRYNEAWNGSDDVVFMALRIKSTDQLNGAIDQINLLATSVLPVWNGTAWVEQATSNPAWCAYNSIAGVQVQRPVSASKIDLQAFKDWADWCSTENVSYNWVHDTAETVLQRFRAIAVVGNASMSIRDGLYSVVRDTEQTVPVQVITPRNAKNFSSDRVFKNLPHALRVKYVDNTYWEQDEYIVYRDLYDKTTSTVFEELDTQGITDTDQARRFGAYFMRAAQLRPEVYHADMDFENLIATRGDLVRIAYDTIMVGLQTGRIKGFDNDFSNLQTNGGFETGDSTGYLTFNGGTIIDNFYNAHTGNYYVSLPSGAGGPNIIGQLITVSPGETMYVEAWVMADPSSPPVTSITLAVRWYDSLGTTSISYNSVNSVTPAIATGWYKLHGQITAPAGAGTVRIDVGESTGTGNWLVDSMFISRGQINTITLDESIVMDGTSSYGIRIRKNNGEQIVVPVNNVIGISNEITPTTPLTDLEVSVGDLVIFGIHGEESIDAKITQIEYNSDLGARLSMVDAAPDIYNLGVAPVYDPHITKPVDITTLKPQIPTISHVVSDESVMMRANDGSLITVMAISFVLASGNNVPIEKIQVRYKVQGANGWSYAEEEPSRGVIKITGLEDESVMEFQLRSKSPYGQFSDWSVLQSHQVIGKTSKPSDVSVFTATIRDFNVYLTWDPIPDIDVAGYELRFGTDWDTATFLQLVGVSNYYIAGVSGQGTLNYLIKAVDVVGNYSKNARLASVVINRPSAVNLSVEVIDNNVLLRWTEPASTLPILHYEIRRGATFNTAEVIGTKDGLFTVIFENVSGTYKYWVVAIDQSLSYGTETSVSAQVSQPPDYILNIDWTDDWTGTATNLAENSTGLSLGSIGATTKVIGPVDVSTNYQTHFTGNSWTTPQDQVTAGFSYFAQPGLTAAQYVQTFDYGATLSSSVVTVSQNTTTIVGTVAITYTISLSANGSSWTDYTNTTRVFGTNFRYVKVTIDIAYSSPTLDDLVVMDPINVRLDSKLRTDTGSDSVSSATSGKTVNFNLSFVDVESIIVTPQVTVTGNNQQIIPVVDFTDVANPTSFKVYLFDGSGNRTTGPFYWTARGY